jgi:FKBP12-rapamycin complex-associated protein
MVPLICQALTTSPSDEAVWLEGLRLLADPKLRTAMSITSSIWLPLLLKGLDASGPEVVILAALRLLLQVADTIEPIKSCLNKPLRALGMHPELSSAEEFEMAVSELGITILDEQKHPIGRPMTSVSTFLARHDTTRDSLTLQTTVTSQANTPMPVVPTSREQPRLAEILARNLPSQTRSAQHAWTDTLLSSPHDNSSVWLHNLFQATLEGSCVPEMVITSRVSRPQGNMNNS